MDETGESKISFIPDIQEEFEHNVGNSLVSVRTAAELLEMGRVFDEQEDKEWLDELRSAREQLLARLDEILQSEFDVKGELTKDSIRSFRDLVSRSDFASAEDIRSVINAFKEFRPPVDDSIAESKEKMQQSL